MIEYPPTSPTLFRPSAPAGAPKTSLCPFASGSAYFSHPTDHQVLPRLLPPGKASLSPQGAG